MIRLRDLHGVTCRPDTTIRDVMQLINESPHLLQVVTDEDGRLLGTVTDGDVRRALLQDLSLNSLVSECMNTDAISGKKGEEADNMAILTSSSVSFLPIVDAGGAVVEILVSTQPSFLETALVMAGGPGTRLGEKTHSTPKPLLKVGDKPILEHILCALEEAGVGQVFVSVHYLAHQIERFIAERDNRVPVSTLLEDQRLGTAGSLSLLPKPIHSPVLIVNGDLLTDTDLHALHTLHHRHGYEATIAVARYDVDIPFGVIRRSDDGSFSGIEEKPSISHFIAAGIYYLSPEFCALVQEGKPMDMPELLLMGRSLGLGVGLFPIHEYWADLGNLKDLEKAEKKHAKAR